MVEPLPGVCIRHGDFAFAVQQTAERAGGHLAGLVVVGGKKAHVVLAIDAGVKHGDGNAGCRRAIERSQQHLAFGGRHGHGIHAPRDETIDNLELPRKVGLRSGAVPLHLHAILLAPPSRPPARRARTDATWLSAPRR
jgi:hypothetical protein